MRLILTRRYHSYMLTALPPVLANVDGTSIPEVYFAAGEPIGINNICRRGAESLFGVKLRPLQSAEVELDASLPSASSIG